MRSVFPIGITCSARRLKRYPLKRCVCVGCGKGCFQAVTTWRTRMEEIAKITRRCFLSDYGGQCGDSRVEDFTIHRNKVDRRKSYGYTVAKLFDIYLFNFLGECMTKFAFALLMTAFVSTGAIAQGAPGAVGIIQSTDGLVTVSQGNALGNAFKDERILDGARVVTTGTGTTVVRLNNGCLVKLDPNQSVTIDSKLDCRAQNASIQSTGAASAGASGSESGGFNTVGLAALGLGVIGAIVNQRSSGF